MLEVDGDVVRFTESLSGGWWTEPRTSHGVLRFLAPDALSAFLEDAGFTVEEQFAAAGLETRFVQVNNSLTARRGTLRGMHYQLPPAARPPGWGSRAPLRPDRHVGNA